MDTKYFSAKISFWALEGLICLIGLMLASVAFMTNTSAGLFVSCVMFATCIMGTTHAMVAISRSTKPQIINWGFNKRRKLLSLICVVGVYAAESLLYFALSDEYGAVIWQHDFGGKFFIVMLVIGCILAIIGMAGKYHQLVWPNNSE